MLFNLTFAIFSCVYLSLIFFCTLLVIYKIIQVLKNMSMNSMESHTFKIIPPIDNHHGDEWMSPLEIISFFKVRASSKTFGNPSNIDDNINA